MSATGNDSASTSASAASELTLSRVFAAPRALVYRAWTERDHLVQWLAPKGFTIPYCEGEAMPGGAFRCCMVAPDGTEHWLSGVYREVEADRKLVYTHAWDDADGKPGPATLVTVTLEDADGGTRLTLHQSGFATRESRDDHAEGWSECLDKLADLLAGKAAHDSR